LRADAATGFATSATCLESDDGTNTYAVDVDLPQAGEVFYYLVRTENACGSGSLGSISGGAERTGIDCPTVP
jgi:hypothetical protein